MGNQGIFPGNESDKDSVTTLSIINKFIKLTLGLVVLDRTFQICRKFLQL